KAHAHFCHANSSADLARLPIGWKHPVDRKSRKTGNIGACSFRKSPRLFRNTLSPTSTTNREHEMKQVLVVDDSSVIRKVAKRILEGLHFHAIEAEDGAKALSACSFVMPDA